ncbi:jg13750, partial [Pararge aegeria aegeria]
MQISQWDVSGISRSGGRYRSASKRSAASKPHPRVSKTG